MQNTLAHTAQMVMDLFYQNLKAEEDYFEFEHFVFCARAAYFKLIEAEAEKARQFARADGGFAVITLTQDWLISETVTVKNSTNGYYATLSQSPFSFPYDQMGFGVQSVEPAGGGEEYIRISAEQRWKFRHLGTIRKNFFFVRGDQVALVNRQKSTIEEKCVVWYAPGLGGNPETDLIPAGKQMDVVTMSLAIMKQAAQGAVINTTNNQNPNAIIQSEIDKETLK